jgi:hypothetical protein
VELAPVDVSIGEEVDEHRGHVRLDHARALGHRADDEVADAHGANLRSAVGREDRARGLVERARPELAAHATDGRLDLVHGEGDADDAGARRDDVPCLDPELLRQPLGHRGRVGLAVRREDVRILADDGEDLGTAVGQSLATVQDGVARAQAPREHSGRRPRRVELDHREVEHALVLDARGHGRAADAVGLVRQRRLDPHFATQALRMKGDDVVGRVGRRGDFEMRVPVVEQSLLAFHAA